MRGKTLETILQEMPATPESIEQIQEALIRLNEDQYKTENPERKRIVKLNINTCLLGIKAIERKIFYTI